MILKQAVQVVVLDSESRYYEQNIVNDQWHGVLGYCGPRTICGIQLDDEDGYGPSALKINKLLTCPHCLTIINEILEMVVAK